MIKINWMLISVSTNKIILVRKKGKIIYFFLVLIVAPYYGASHIILNTTKHIKIHTAC